jgi:beta-mannosidase
MYRTLFLLSITTLFVVSCNQVIQTNPLSEMQIVDGWEFKTSGDSIWRSANVPGCNFTDLMAHGIINDPYYRDNEKEVQWIEELDWEYRTSFFVDSGFLEADNIILQFEGLDTYAQVELNDRAFLSADNMFRSWEKDCKRMLNPGKNTLRILFSSPVKKNTQKYSKLNYKLPDKRVFTRKALYQFGWDWGPRLVTSGIWKPVSLIAWNHFNVTTVQIHQQELVDQEAQLEARFQIRSEQEQKVEIQISDKSNKLLLASMKHDLLKGNNAITLPFTIINPRLWWPNGLGEPHLYDLQIEVKSNHSYHNQERTIGIREIQLITDKDTSGTSFYFQVNGIPVFAKGANYIPQDNFPARVGYEKYRATIQAAKDANMNMLRVWGGGIYENDLFYDLCDENGIMVWQDFMFACAMYPGDKKFLANVENEIRQNILRLRNHPSIVLWCGNNEVDNGWKDWGWQKQLGYSQADSIQVYGDYKKLFEELIPSVIAENDSERYYWPSSPLWGWGHAEANFEGDSHYWGVWWGKEPFSIYEEKIGRFMSEFGFQGFPHQKTLEEVSTIEDRILFSEVMYAHQKHPVGYETILEYMDRAYKLPDTFAEFNYLSQVVQADGIELALKAHRRAMPHCMGTLYWQLNDCWPVVSWSGLDYKNRWKALHYKARDSFMPIIVSGHISEGILKVYIVSDKIETIKARLNVVLMDFDGEVLWQDSTLCNVSGNSSKIYYQYAIKDLPSFNNQFSFIVIDLITDHEKLSDEQIYFDIPKSLKFNEAEITAETSVSNNGIIIKLSSNTLVKDLQLSYPNRAVHFSNNYFDLLPGRPVTVEVLDSVLTIHDRPVYTHMQMIREVIKR